MLNKSVDSVDAFLMSLITSRFSCKVAIYYPNVSPNNSGIIRIRSC